MNKLFFSVSLAALLLGSDARGENWPQWRGPHGNGVSLETNLPDQLSEEHLAWKLALPAWSGSTPIVWENRIFLNVAEGDDLFLWCVDGDRGEPIWKRHLSGGNQKMRKQNMSSPSPVTDGQRVWAMTGTGVLAAFDFEGKELWRRNVQDEYGAFGLNWGYASSTLLHEDTLYVQVLHGMKTDDPSYVMAVDKLTGKNKWRVERPTDAIVESPDAYTTPALLRYPDRFEIVVSGGDYVTGHDPNTGREIWRAGGLNPEQQRFYRIVASPVVSDGMIYASSRVKPLLALKAGGTGDITESHLAWLTDKGPDVPTPVTDGSLLYVLDDRGVLWCRDAKSGEVVWGPERIRPGTYSASLVLADGKLYAISEDGVASIVKAGREFELVAENELEGYTLSSAAVSDGQIFIRTEKFLYCFGKRPGSSQASSSAQR